MVAGLASNQSRLGADVTIIATEQDHLTQDNLVPTDPAVEVRVFPRGGFSRLWTGYSHPLRQFLHAEARHYDVIHIHELWHYPQFVACRQASKRGIPYVVSPHGCLAPWCLQNDRLLKVIYGQFVQRRILRNANLIHVLTSQESEEVRCYGVPNETKVIPNGITLDHDLPSQTKAEHGPTQPFELLFLGRVVPKKKPELLIEAVATLRSRGIHAKAVIAGPCEDDYLNELMQQSVSLGIGDNVLFSGFVTGTSKTQALLSADIFVLPSQQEGFSIASLEAMAHELPVVLSPQCNFPEAAQAGAALEVEPEVGPLTDALESLLKDPVTTREMGLRGRALVEEQYSWDTIAARFLDAYRQIGA